MKYRSDFVANSSSSSFVIGIDIGLKNGDTISFEDVSYCGEEPTGGYFEADISIYVSPKELGLAKSVDEMIRLLTEGIVDDISDDGANVFEKPLPAGWDDDFIQNIRDKVQSMDDILYITITGEEHNYVEYVRSYTYNLETGVYSGDVDGEPIECDGGNGGDFFLEDLDECEIVYHNDDESED